MDKLIRECHELFKNCGFPYFVCGGFALDMFAGKALRKHGDFDISVFKENKQDVIKFLQNNGWSIYGRFLDFDKPITLGLFYLVADPKDKQWDSCDNMWAVKPGSFAEMYQVRDGENLYGYKINEPRLQAFDFIFKIPAVLHNKCLSATKNQKRL